jgi:hypothetical protein
MRDEFSTVHFFCQIVGLMRLATRLLLPRRGH